jgi:signal transduction histidine kinase/DNA-binding response OmpR family regulator
MQAINRLLTVPSTDPDAQRRSRLLNIVLLGVVALATLGLLATIAATISGQYVPERDASLYRATIGMLVSVVVLYLLNRYGLGVVASALFLLLITAAFAVTDEPQQVVQGRSLFMMTIPILLASVLLRPYASFVMAGLISLLLVGIAVGAGLGPTVLGSLPFTALAFFAVAMVSWLSARSLEHALEELRAINRELDQRVEQRTHDLAEALSREQTELSKNQAVLAGIADGVIVFDNDGKAIVANPAIGRILERPFEGMIDSDIESLMGTDVDPSDREMIVALLGEKDLPRSSLKFEWGQKTLSVSFAPVRSASAQVMGTVAVFRDYTREAEIDRMKSDFVSIVSHELRTPLTSIKGYLDLVLMGAAGAVSKQQTSFLGIAKDNTERLNEMVADLLDISRIESGKVELDVQVVSIPEIVERVAASLRREFEDRGLTLTLAVPQDLPEIFGDPGRIAQILINLLSNAYKYTPQGGATVRARLVRNTLQIDVIDTGVGISAGDKEKLFTRFFRAEDAAVRQQPGTGLGLNITKSMVEMHGGEIWVESEPGVGTTFSFTLPVPAGLMEPEPVREPRSTTRPPRPSPQMESRAVLPSGPWILIVDDDIDVAHLFQHQLEKAGYRVTVVTQGSLAVDVARQLQPELITLDLMMDVDGLKVLQELKADPATAGIPVVIVSVIAEPKRGLALGAADYLIKPLNEGELIKRIRRVLDQLDGGTRNKILVVDDEIDIVGWLKHFLTHYGFQVAEAYDGVQALEIVAVDKPDLILLDLKMPRMDGRTTIRRLREKEFSRNIPIIVLSAHPISDETERVEMLGLGVKEFLRKPVTMEQLIAEIEKHLGTDDA